MKKRFLLSFIIIVFIINLCGCCGNKKTVIKKKEIKLTKKIEIKGKASFEIFVPENLEKYKKYPLFFFLSPNGNPNIYYKSFLKVCKSENCIFAGSYDYKNEISHKIFLPAVESSIEYIIKNYPVHPKMIYLCGFSGGAMASYVISHFRENKFAGIISNDGLIHPNLRNTEDLRGSGLKKVAIISGTNDNVVKTVELRNDSALLQRSGIFVKMFTFSGGHQVAPYNVYLKAVRWILK